ncbi:SMC-Scp complex subunit ScpB [Microbulbifer aggregans]|uniref:SMC-Scp complex subunit ScpB n=1 Tax=Microbulbifer aggregans TaxID=1769779 RepID=UPI001CFEEDDF|nr:SMC-Scp complex subunit ScpB [Microbulbifer aggregans]
MSIAPELLRRIVEGALLASGQPLSEDKLLSLIDEGERPEKAELKQALEDIAENSRERGFELRQVASGWRFQVPEDLAPWVNKLWEEKPQKYSRATLETLAIIAYRQPITRGDIEEIRGVAVSSHIVKSLSERGWIKVVGQRDVPGKPSLYATTRGFLDYFNLQSLDDLPTLAEIRDIESLNAALDLGDAALPAAETGESDTSDADAIEPEDGDVEAGDVDVENGTVEGATQADVDDGSDDGSDDGVTNQSEDVADADTAEDPEAELASVIDGQGNAFSGDVTSVEGDHLEAVAVETGHSESDGIEVETHEQEIESEAAVEAESDADAAQDYSDRELESESELEQIGEQESSSEEQASEDLDGQEMNTPENQTT